MPEIDVVIIMRKQVPLHHQAIILTRVMLVTTIWHQSKKNLLISSIANEY